jgi:hypothetical protein
MDRARRELGEVTGFVLATDMASPPLSHALQQLRGEYRFAQTPVAILVKPNEEYRAEQVMGDAKSVEAADAGLGAAELRAVLEAIGKAGGTQPLDTDLALELALRAADALRLVALDDNTVIDYAPAVDSLIAALRSDSEDLQIKCANVLALVNTQPGQQAVASLALDVDRSAELRIAAFNALAESAKRFGNQLAPEQVTQVVSAAKETEDLVMRAAASQALGALNLQVGEASEIIRSHHRG